MSVTKAEPQTVASDEDNRLFEITDSVLIKGTERELEVRSMNTTHALHLKTTEPFQQTGTTPEVSSVSVNSTTEVDFVNRLDDWTTAMSSVWITISVFGFLGNTFLFIMTHNLSIRDQSYALYLAVLVVTDSLVLLVRLIHGAALLAFPLAQPQGPLVGLLDSVFACILMGLELSARCLSAWILGE